MEINLVPLIESVKGLTWQGAAVIFACLAAACYLARLRLIHGREERAFWMSATPEQIQARAATTATLPKPVAAPPSPVGPALMLLVFLGCALVPESGPAPSILQAHRTKPAYSWPPSAAAGELARAGDVGSTKGGGPVRGRPCVPACVRPSVCEDGRCTAVTRKPAPPKPGPHSPSSDVELPAWADNTPDRPGDALLTACAAESALWGAL